MKNYLILKLEIDDIKLKMKRSGDKLIAKGQKYVA